MLSPFYGKLRTDFCSFRFQTTFCASHYLKGRLKTETDYKQSDIQNRIFSDDRSASPQTRLVRNLPTTHQPERKRMNKSCLLLLALLPLSAHADSDDLRRLSEENGRVQQQYRESGWLDGGTPAGDIENDDAYIRIGGQITP